MRHGERAVDRRHRLRGKTTAHIHRTVRLAQDVGAAGILLEDVDSGGVKHVYREDQPVDGTAARDELNPFGTDRDFSGNHLYELDQATRRLDAAIRARTGDLAIIARTDAYLRDPAGGLRESIARAQQYAKVGADAVFIVGLPAALLSTEIVESLGAPLLHLETGDVLPATRSQLAAVA